MHTYVCPLCNYKFTIEKELTGDLPAICHVSQAYDKALQKGATPEEERRITDEFWHLLFHGCEGELVRQEAGEKR